MFIVLVGAPEQSIHQHVHRDGTDQTIDIELDIKMKISCVSQDCKKLLNLLSSLYTSINDSFNAGQEYDDNSLSGHFTLNEK